MRLRIATWNIRKCVGLDRRRDPLRTSRVIAGLDADIVALQEADKRLGHRPAALRRDIVETETGLLIVEAGGHEPSIGWHGNAVLLSPELHVENRHNLHLPGIEPRGALVLDVVTGGRPLRLVATHLGFIRRFRRAQLATIRSYLAGLSPCPTVILGDFNEWSPRHGLEPLSGFDVFSPGPSFHSARPVAPLDRIAVSGGLRVLDGQVVATRETRVASDHLPVVATVAATGQ